MLHGNLIPFSSLRSALIFQRQTTTYSGLVSEADTHPEGLAMSLTTPFSVQKLQTALHAKAKESPNLRFHALSDKVYWKDVLAYAYDHCCPVK